MSALVRLKQWQSSVKLRSTLQLLLIALPCIILICIIGLRFFPIWLSVIVGTVAFLVLWILIHRASSALNNSWLIRQLDERWPELEDSSDLLFKPETTLTELQHLQRQRIEQRVMSLNAVDLRAAWHWKHIAAIWLIALLGSGLIIFWPQTKTAIANVISSQQRSDDAKPVIFALSEKKIFVKAPPYTGLALREEASLQSKFPEGSALTWQLKVQPQPDSISLLFHNDERMDLRFNGTSWSGSRRMQQSSLYRLLVSEKRLQPDTLYRLDAIKDQAPQIRVLQPDRGLSVLKRGQSTWALAFEAEDDYGLGAAQLRIQLAQGSGENIQFKEQSQLISGQGTRKQKRYSRVLDLIALGVGPGDDVIVQFSVNDQRSPQINTARSASYILRWPAQQTVETSGLDGTLKKIMPAYFRSQRQIIIDTEKLLADKPRLSADEFSARSDQIGVDQRILRLRYGQFLGEESEQPEAPIAEQEKDHEDEDTHDHAQESPSPERSAINSDRQLLEQFGHTHDIPEAATLLDDQTKELLRAALNEMWQAELNLRQVQPKLALPYENRALGLIKKVQQAERIYLARTGLELPPIDESRRLTGDRAGLQSRQDFMQAAEITDGPLIQFWQALDALQFSDNTPNRPDFVALRRWMNAHPERVSDALGIAAKMDALENDLDCQSCLSELKAQLWPVLIAPPAQPKTRNAPNPRGQRYLDALRKERKP